MLGEGRTIPDQLGAHVTAGLKLATPGGIVAPAGQRSQVVQGPKNGLPKVGQLPQRAARKNFGYPVKVNHVRILHPRVIADIDT
jgi:hypothetical protein